MGLFHPLASVLCEIFGHHRTLDYGPEPDSELVVVCSRCGTVLER